LYHNLPGISTGKGTEIPKSASAGKYHALPRFPAPLRAFFGQKKKQPLTTLSCSVVKGYFSELLVSNILVTSQILQILGRWSFAKQGLLWFCSKTGSDFTVEFASSVLLYARYGLFGKIHACGERFAS